MDPRLNLITSPSQLESSNDGLSNFRYEEVAPRPLATGDSFFNSEVRFTYNNSGSTRSIENMSYIRARLVISKANGNDLVEDDQIAPVMNPIACLFRKCEWMAGGQTITSVSENLPQVSALQNRMLLSKAQLDGSASSTHLMDAYFEDRQSLVISDSDNSKKSKLRSRGLASQLCNINEAADTLAYAAGVFTYVDAAGADLDLRNYYKVGDYIEVNNLVAADTVGSSRVRAKITALTQLTLTINGGVASSTIGVFAYAANVAGNSDLNIKKLEPSRRARSVEICWRPPLGIFDTEKATPAGKYELVLQPEAVDAAKKAFFESVGFSSKTAADYNLDVQSMFLYVAKITAPFVKDATIMLDLHETRLQSQRLPDGSGQSEQQFDFVVAPTTRALTMAFQDARYQNDTRYSSSKLRVGDNQELQLQTYQIQYADQRRPRRVPYLNYDSSTANLSVDHFTEQYLQTMQQVKSLYSPGSAETIEEWRERGQYYHLDFPRSAEDRATVANVYVTFNQALTNTNLLIFAHARKVVTLSIRDSQVEQVSVDYT